MYNELYNKAYYNYIDCQIEIGKMNELANYRFTNKKILGDFDIILQFVLLYIAYSNKHINEYEATFIEKITFEMDILKVINEKSEIINDLTWDNIGRKLEGKDFQYFYDSVKKLFLYSINEFTLFLGYVDAIDEYNYFAFFKEKITNICNAFSLIEKNQDNLINIALDENLFKDYARVKQILQSNILTVKR